MDLPVTSHCHLHFLRPPGLRLPLSPHHWPQPPPSGSPVHTPLLLQIPPPRLGGATALSDSSGSFLFLASTLSKVHHSSNTPADTPNPLPFSFAPNLKSIWWWRHPMKCSSMPRPANAVQGTKPHSKATLHYSFVPRPDRQATRIQTPKTLT